MPQEDDVNRDDTPLTDFDPNSDDEDELDSGATIDGRVLGAAAQRGIGPMTEQDARSGSAGTIGQGEKVPSGPGGILGGVSER